MHMPRCNAHQCLHVCVRMLVRVCGYGCGCGRVCGCVYVAVGVGVRVGGGKDKVGGGGARNARVLTLYTDWDVMRSHASVCLT